MSELTDLKVEVEEVVEAATRKLGERDAIEKQIEEIRIKVVSIDKDLDLLKVVNQILQDRIKENQEVGIPLIEKLVSLGLREVYQDPSYTCRIDLPEKRGRKEAHFYVSNERGGREIETEVKTGRGWGVAELIGLLLQAAVVAGHPEIAQFLFIDDPLGHMDNVDQKARAGGVMREISEEIQLLFTTTSLILVNCCDTKYLVHWTEDGPAGAKPTKRGM